MAQSDPMPPTPPTPAERIAAECYCMPLRMLARVVSGVYDEALRPLRLRAAQLNILVVIARLSGEATPAKIAAILLIEKSTLSRDLDRLEQCGWIASSADGRLRRLAVTAAGRKLLRDAMPAWQRAQAKVVALVGKTAAESLSVAAARLRRQKGRRARR